MGYMKQKYIEWQEQQPEDVDSSYEAFIDSMASQAEAQRDSAENK